MDSNCGESENAKKNPFSDIGSSVENLSDAKKVEDELKKNIAKDKEAKSKYRDQLLHCISYFIVFLS